LTGGDQTATISGAIFVPPPGWARVTDRIMARLRARSIDEKLLNGADTDGSAVMLVRRGRLLNRRYRSRVADALRRMIAAARHGELNHFRAQIPLMAGEVLDNAPVILTLADELEHEDPVSPRGVILADRLITDGGSPVYPPTPNRPREDSVESAVRRARAALHMG
jgi:hypothetical protein